MYVKIIQWTKITNQKSPLKEMTLTKSRCAWENMKTVRLGIVTSRSKTYQGSSLVNVNLLKS